MMNSYAAVDSETTGLNPKTGKIMEIGVTEVIDGQVAEELHTIIHPRHQLEEGIVELIGIGDEILRDAPGIEEAIGQVVISCEGSPLARHRIMFSYSLLKRATVNAELGFEKESVDALGLCRRFVPEGEWKNLGVVCRYLRVEIGAVHRALSDAQAVSGLYQELMRHHGKDQPGAFEPKTSIYKAKEEQPTTKRQKEGLRELLKYHRIGIAMQIDYLSRSEASGMTDKIISKYGRVVRG